MQRLTWRNLAADYAAAPSRESGLVQWRTSPESQKPVLEDSLSLPRYRTAVLEGVGLPARLRLNSTHIIDQDAGADCG